MKLKTINYTKNGGWSEPFPDLDSDKTMILIFGSSQCLDNPEIVNKVIKAYPKSKITGCSTAGEIFGSSINDDTLSVAITMLEGSDSNLEVTFSEIKKTEESFKAGENITKTLLKESLRAIFVLSDGLIVNGSELVKGLNHNLPKGVVITGGLAGDGDRFKRTWVIADRKLSQGKITAIGLYGSKLKIGHGSQGGWDPFGPERRVTRSKANVLFELDGQPALKLYKEYLGERSKGLPATGLLFPLCIRDDKPNASEIVRTLLAIDETQQSMTFAGDIPTGYLAKLMRANFDRLVTGANEAAITAANLQATGGPILSVAISCVGRRLLLGERTEEETITVLGTLPKGTQQVGFYSYGEISPYSSGTCELHNQTMTLTTLAEGK